MSTSVSPRSAPVHPTRQQLDELDALLQRMLDLPVNQVEEQEPAEDTEPSLPEYHAPVSYKVPIADSPPRLEPRVVPAEETRKSSLPPPPPAVAAAPMAPAPVAPVPVAPAPVAAAPFVPASVAPAPVVAREPGPDDWVRLASTWQPSAQTWQPLAQSWQQAARPADRLTSPPAPPVPAPEPPAAYFPPTVAPVAPAPPPLASMHSEALEQESLEDFIVPRDDLRSHAPSPAPEEAKAPVAGYAWWQWPFLPINFVFDILTLPLGPLGTGLRSRAGRNLLAATGIGCLAAAAALVAADGFGWIW